MNNSNPTVKTLGELKIHLANDLNGNDRKEGHILLRPIYGDADV